MDKLDAMMEQVGDFCDARDWRKYHTPKELAIGMATESSDAKLSKTKLPTHFFSSCVLPI